MFLGDTPIADSGTGKTLRYTGLGLAAKGHDVAYCCDGHDGCPKSYEHPIWPWRRGERSWVDRAIQDWSPDTLVCFGDAWYYVFLYELKRDLVQQNRNLKVILWLTVDCAPFPMSAHNNRVLDAADHIVCTTRFGTDVVTGETAGDLPTARRVRYNASTIGLGVDRSIYHPDLPETREQVRQAIPEERKVVLFVGNNQGRKHPGAVLEAMSHLKRAYPGQYTLWMKTSLKGDYDLAELISHNGLMWTDDQVEKRKRADVLVIEPRLDESAMALIYKRADVLLSAACAGAPELPILEARACGTPAVGVRTSCFDEVCNVTVPPVGAMWAYPVVRHQMPDPLGLANAVHAVAQSSPAAGDVPSWDATIEQMDALVRSETPDFLGGIVV
jgi:glycosyltransferase involved in cell wall biosynthesis